MTTAPAPRAALSTTAAALACLAVPVLIAIAPDSAMAVLAAGLALVAVLAAVAAARSHGFDRAGWALFCAGHVVMFVGNVGVSATGVSFVPAVSAIVGLALVSSAMRTLVARSVGDLVATHLQWSILAATMVLGVWMLAEPAGLRTSAGRPHDVALLTDVSLVLSVVVTSNAVLAGLSRSGILRPAVLTIAGALALGLVAEVILWTTREAPSLHVVLALRGLELALATCALLAVLVHPGRGPHPRRLILDRTRDLTVISLLTLAIVIASIVGSRNGGLDLTQAHTLATLVCLLVLTHIYEAHHSRALTASIEAQERHMRLLVSETRDIIIELDASGRILFASEAMRNILGLRLADYLGHHISEVIPELTSDTLGHVAHSPSARVQETMRVESALTSASAATVHAESVVTPLPRGYLVAVRDVSERVGLHSRLQQVTYHDSATGLPNRSSLDRELRHRLYEAASGDIALALVDLNPAGPGENAIGDDSGEEVQRLCGQALRNRVRPGDMVARFSEHRFAVLLRAGTTSAQAMAELERLVRELSTSDVLGDVGLHTTAAVCVGGHSGAEIVRNAELALRQAHAAGNRSVRLFEPTMLAQFARTRDLRRRLAREPDTDRWTVLYQPVVNLQTGRPEGVEALLRWTDPEGDFIGIEEVIRLAEEFGSIITIGSWVLDQSVAQGARWERGGRALQVAVNVSVHQLTAPGFARIVADTLGRHAFPPQLLTLEITETVVFEQTAETIATLSELRGLGVRIAIDDFGTGYSGLANIRSLPLDILKIDRTFIQGLGAGGGDEAVVNAVTHLGHELGLAITAEGIETPEQERLARALGITAAQGYLYARPLPAADVTALVADADASADLPR